MRLILLIAVSAWLHAASFEAQYVISYGIFGRIGTTVLRFSSEDGRYRIDADARLEGIAALLARHHCEHHTSLGRVDSEGRLIPERYETLRTLDDYQRKQRYTFDRRHRYVIMKEEVRRTVSHRRFDPQSMRYETEITPEQYSMTDILLYRADNDLLSLYFNARPILKRMPLSSRQRFTSVGPRDGKVIAERLDRPERFIFYINQDIFRSRTGELYVEMDQSMFIERAVLKDVFLFGDLKVKREWLRQSP